jgi:hypothetical protein
MSDNASASTSANTSNRNINFMNKTGFYNKQESIFSNTFTVALIVVIGLAFVGYAFYFYYYKAADNNIQANSSYYGKDIALYQPVFQETANTITDCISMCENDITCDGMTYNNKTQICTGTKNGQLRNETAEYSAWIKPAGEEPSSVSKDFKKAVLIGYAKSFRVLDGLKIMNPYMLGNFCWSFNLTIYDFYKNYGSWRHIFHKGTPITTGQILSYQSWENLVQDFPNQQIGVWLAPFTNNLRIAMTTTSLENRTYGSYTDAFVEKCDPVSGNCFITDMPSGKWTDTARAGDGSNPKPRISTNLEYLDQDLQNIPINTELNIIVNVYNTIVEVYFNGKIVKISQLEGTPVSDRKNLYVLNEKTANCEISNLLFYPDVVKKTDVSSIMALTAHTASD